MTFVITKKQREEIGEPTQEELDNIMKVLTSRQREKPYSLKDEIYPYVEMVKKKLL